MLQVFKIYKWKLGKPESSLALRHLECVWTELQGQVYVGSEPFIPKKQKLIEVPKAQRRAEKTALTDFAKTYNKQ